MKNDIEKYLTLKGVAFRVSGTELIAKCIFSDCDSNSRGSEAHLYFSKETGLYQCKKCGAEGNMTTLKKHFGDAPVKQNKSQKVTQKLVDELHSNLPQRIVEYLNARGLSDEIISSHKIGYGSFYGRDWIVIPIKDINGGYSFLKLRQDPRDGKDKITWPKSDPDAGIEVKSQIFDWETLLCSNDKVLICEGEMDALLMKSKGISAITNTHGASTVRDSWFENFKPETSYYVCYDNDTVGKNGMEKIAVALLTHGCKNIFLVELPEVVGEKGDLGDYVIRLGLPIEDIFTKYAKPFPEKIDTTEFNEIEISDVCLILDSTIKKDDANKAICFLAMLTTYTDDAQVNLFFNAPSSTGKSHIPLSVVELFPENDVIKLAYCSPAAFWHEQGQFDKENNRIIVDLSKKILVFIDMPDTSLISKLRPMLSHDAKELHLKIADKNQKGGNRTKNVTVVGYPSVYFCSAGLRVDEQESTRFIMLSPSVEHEKILRGIQQAIAKSSDAVKFAELIACYPERLQLKRRILAIKQENIVDVKIENVGMIETLFLPDGKEATAQPRQQRDIKKIISIIKALALLNPWYRKREGDYIWATDKDIKDGFDLWSKISSGQEFGLAPYVFEIYTKIILALYNEASKEYGEFSSSEEKKKFVTRKDILKRHREIHGRPLSMAYLRQHILPQLEQVGLIMQERSLTDGREMVVIPLEIDLEADKTEI